MPTYTLARLAPSVRTLTRAKDGGGAVTYYHQRVRCSIQGWCYYTKTVIDASPLSAETTPNWTGTISLHSVLAKT